MSSITSYRNLDTEALIHLAIDFVKVGQALPVELRDLLEELELLELLDPKGATDEED